MLRVEPENRLGRGLGWIGLVCLGAIILPARISSQTQPQSGSEGAAKDEVSCRLKSNLVLVDVEVRDANGSLAPKLIKDRFTVYENGNRQDLAFFSSEPESNQEGLPIKYKLGYYPGPATEDWEFRRIRVKVRNGKAEGLRISYDPPVYFMPPRDWKFD